MIDTMYNMAHAELAEYMSWAGLKADALIVDAPYSERTHSAHDSASESAGDRRSLAYSSWAPDDVDAFVRAWSPITLGWMVSMTDHELAPAWSSSMERAGRYVFSPLACVQPGSRVRISGDGPAQWSVWAIVSRPKSSAYARWGSLPGAYVVPSGEPHHRSGVVGGKPLWLMRALVRDYSRPGELVCDPCAGAGTTLLAAKLEDRAWIGCDIDENHTRIARGRLADMPIEDLKKTLPLFGTGENK